MYNHIFNKEELQFIALSEKFRVELGEVERQIDTLEERRAKLIAMIDGQIEVEGYDRITDPDNLDFEYAIDNFLRNVGGASRKIIVEVFEHQGYTKYAIDKAIKRCEERGLIVNKGTHTKSIWHSKN